MTRIELARVRDDRAFDRAVVRSALDFLERFHGPVDAAAAMEAAAPFAWVPRIVRLRARLVSARTKRWTLAMPAPTDRADDNTLAKHCNTLATRFWIALTDIQARSDALPSDPHKRFELREQRAMKDRWLSRQLRALEFIQRLQYRDNRMQRVTIPALKSVEGCLAYSLFILHEDQWGFRDRVAVCRYERKHDSEVHFEPRHWFIDVDDYGKLPLGPTRKFCDDHHANACRQRELRRRQAAAKHK